MEMKSVFGGLIRTLYITKERIHELENMSTETSQTEIQRKKKNKKNRKTEYARTLR